MTTEAHCAVKVGGTGRPVTPVRLSVAFGLAPDQFGGSSTNCQYVVRLSSEFNRGANQVFSMSVSDALVVSSAVGGVLAVAWIFRVLRRVF